MIGFSLLVSLVLLLFIGNVYGHTVKICVSVEGTTATFYAGTYHSTNQIDEQGGKVGGVILSNGPVGNGRYDFTSYVVDDGNQNPSGVDLNKFACSKCPTYNFNGIRAWQKVDINGLQAGTWEVTTTKDDAIEWPWCTNFPDLTLDPEFFETQEPTNEPTPAPTENPTSAPTAQPTWYPPCNNDPCDCNNIDYDPNCAIGQCHANGCDECKLGPNNENGYYWKLDYNYPCVKCNDIFDNCMFCQDFNGCGQCNDGYIRTHDSQENLWYCIEGPPTPQPVELPSGNNCPNYDYTPYNDCLGDTNCAVCQTWGCETCASGYYKMGNKMRCQSCTDNYGINCAQCLDWQGCTSCVGGTQPQWNSNCNDETCPYVNI